MGAVRTLEGQSDVAPALKCSHIRPKYGPGMRNVGQFGRARHEGPDPVTFFNLDTDLAAHPGVSDMYGGSVLDELKILLGQLFLCRTR